MLAVANGGISIRALVRGRDYLVLYRTAGAAEPFQRQLRFLARKRKNVRLLYFLDLHSNQVKSYRNDRIEHVTLLDLD